MEKKILTEINRIREIMGVKFGLLTESSPIYALLKLLKDFDKGEFLNTVTKKLNGVNLPPQAQNEWNDILKRIGMGEDINSNELIKFLKTNFKFTDGQLFTYMFRKGHFGTPKFWNDLDKKFIDKLNELYNGDKFEDDTIDKLVNKYVEALKEEPISGNIEGFDDILPYFKARIRKKLDDTKKNFEPKPPKVVNDVPATIQQQIRTETERVNKFPWNKLISNVTGVNLIKWVWGGKTVTKKILRGLLLNAIFVSAFHVFRSLFEGGVYKTFVLSDEDKTVFNNVETTPGIKMFLKPDLNEYVTLTESIKKNLDNGNDKLVVEDFKGVNSRFALKYIAFLYEKKYGKNLNEGLDEMSEGTIASIPSKTVQTLFGKKTPDILIDFDKKYIIENVVKLLPKFRIEDDETKTKVVTKKKILEALSSVPHYPEKLEYRNIPDGLPEDKKPNGKFGKLYGYSSYKGTISSGHMTKLQGKCEITDWMSDPDGFVDCINKLSVEDMNEVLGNTIYSYEYKVENMVLNPLSVNEYTDIEKAMEDVFDDLENLLNKINPNDGE